MFAAAARRRHLLVLAANGAPSAGVSATGLGASAPAYYEIGEPTGDFADIAPKGVMLVIHGGGWYAVGQGAVESERSDADRWRARGWRTLNISHRACRASLGDVQWFYDEARRLWGTDLPYCALGSSAGGHLALLLAASRPGMYCAIDRGGPTDALTLPSQTTPRGGSDGPRWVYNMMVAAVGPDDLRWWSPALFAQQLKSTRVLAATAADDPFTPIAQANELRDNILAQNPSGYTDVFQLAAGSTPWIHASVSDAALQLYDEREVQLVAPLG
jgi:hypothetical protein